MRTIRQISEREIALALVLELAETRTNTFSLLGFYDDDAYFLEDLAERLDVRNDKPFLNKVRRVTRALVAGRALTSEMRGTYKEYCGEPAKQMNYSLPVGKARLLTRGETEHTWAPEQEASFLIRRAYPEPERSDAQP